ncbi:molybdenum cofactor biosynthesis protein MoaE [Candidatus Bathyarchaeota archaeon]|nr:molybdenum cofactor biosynthesis protein MoaE [Candidatus Bathyarchaeota archaeon]
MSYQAGVHKKGDFSVIDLIKNTTKSKNYSKAGAIAQFIGVVRGETIQGENVQKLKLEAYEEKANEVLLNICRELSVKKGIVNVQIHHLLGEFEVGEDLVYVSVAGAHRTDVFPVLHEAVERYKKEVPVFKKELITRLDGIQKEYWVSEKEM